MPFSVSVQVDLHTTKHSGFLLRGCVKDDRSEQVVVLVSRDGEVLWNFFDNEPVTSRQRMPVVGDRIDVTPGHMLLMLNKSDGTRKEVTAAAYYAAVKKSASRLLPDNVTSVVLADWEVVHSGVYMWLKSVKTTASPVKNDDSLIQWLENNKKQVDEATELWSDAAINMVNFSYDDSLRVLMSDEEPELLQADECSEEALNAHAEAMKWKNGWEIKKWRKDGIIQVVESSTFIPQEHRTFAILSGLLPAPEDGAAAPEEEEAAATEEAPEDSEETVAETIKPAAKTKRRSIGTAAAAGDGAGDEDVLQVTKRMKDSIDEVVGMMMIVKKTNEALVKENEELKKVVANTAGPSKPSAAVASPRMDAIMKQHTDLLDKQIVALVMENAELKEKVKKLEK